MVLKSKYKSNSKELLDSPGYFLNFRQEEQRYFWNLRYKHEKEFLIVTTIQKDQNLIQCPKQWTSEQGIPE